MEMNILRELRKEKNYSQNELAKLLNITQQAYANYENGIRSIPIETLIKISNIYEVTLDYITGQTPMKTSTLSIESIEHLTEWNKLTERNKGKVDLLIEQLLEEQAQTREAI